MQTNIKTTNFKLTDDIYDYIEKRLDGLTKYIDCAGESVRAWIEIERDKRHRTGDVYRVELQFSLPGSSVRAEAKGESWRTAFDRANNKAQRELRKHKETKCG